jgi:hypothetical protein
MRTTPQDLLRKAIRAHAMEREREAMNKEFMNDSSQAERREALKADCYFNRTQSEAGSELGRFAHLSKTSVVGASPSPVPKQPPNSPFHHDPCGAEPSLGYSVHDMPGQPAVDAGLEAAQQVRVAEQLEEQEKAQAALRAKDRRY